MAAPSTPDPAGSAGSTFAEVTPIPFMLSPRLKRRLIRHHARIAFACALALPAFARIAYGHTGTAFQWSMATAYVGLALLMATLIPGPLAALSGRRLPVSNDLRRDLGLWAGGMALVHFVVGWQVHAEHRYEYFFREASGGVRFVPRFDAFGAANYAGLGAVILALILLAISNDRSLRALGAARWKRVQQWTYWYAALVVLHGAAYQLIERRAIPFVIGAVTLAAVAFVFQLRGMQARRQKDFGKSGSDSTI